VLNPSAPRQGLLQGTASYKGWLTRIGTLQTQTAVSIITSHYRKSRIDPKNSLRITCPGVKVSLKPRDRLSLTLSATLFSSCPFLPDTSRSEQVSFLHIQHATRVLTILRVVTRCSRMSFAAASVNSSHGSRFCSHSVISAGSFIARNSVGGSSYGQMSARLSVSSLLWPLG
jgi:hypothetical protein